MVEQIQEGETSGAKDSNGHEISSIQLQHETADLQTEPAGSAQPKHADAPAQAGLTSANPFSVLEDMGEDTTHTDSYSEHPSRSTINDQHHTRNKAPLLEPGTSRLEEQCTAGMEEEAKTDEAVTIPALAQLYPPQPSDQFQGIVELLQHEISTVQPPLLLTNDDTEPEEENDLGRSQALVTYGSDTEVICKSRKSYPPLTMLTRSKTQGSTYSSKKGHRCCKD
ncbi:hypothetical protein FRX31_013978 [Thalictrum thalictroides]|uniref:Uncharacterized protein n=1 Tax=Thalictrum thalictroides TaxID=46969 RepID=A0A7J6WJ17_THATH|nr:hypothetical protein FRX31_013978 [Thalictrum thalictroides]